MQNIQRKLLEVTQAVLDGDVRLSIGCLEIEHCLIDLELDMVPEFLIIKGFNSETDNLPANENIRKLWNKESLIEKDKELLSIEEYFKASIIEACENIIARFKNNSVG